MIAAAVRRHIDEDTAYEDLRQRWVDAFEQGKRAGRLGLGAGLSTQYWGRELREWMQGFNEGAAEHAVAEDRKRARRACLGCNCGGVGRCLDAG